MPRLLIATTNAGKAREIGALLAGTGWECVSTREAGVRSIDVIETGRSYLENAVLKAVAYAAASGMPTLADDSGLEVDALDGAPGVVSARFGGPSVGSDAERTALLLRRLDGVPAARRGARFRAVVALALPGGQVYVREGVLPGRIASAPRGASGFGYDPVLELADGRTVAELGEEKQAISHRAQAVRAMIDVLNSLGAHHDQPTGAR
ncbi:MAG: non-canonical purine NTP pyrophosphatase [Dehalococcoidia bacterium]